MQTVTTVRDFTQLFDAYAQFEESTIALAMELSDSTPDQLVRRAGGAGGPAV